MKKLKLNKEVIASLSDEQLSTIQGGQSFTYFACDALDSFFNKCPPPAPGPGAATCQCYSVNGMGPCQSY